MAAFIEAIHESGLATTVQQLVISAINVGTSWTNLEHASALTELTEGV